MSKAYCEQSVIYMYPSEMRQVAEFLTELASQIEGKI